MLYESWTETKYVEFVGRLPIIDIPPTIGDCPSVT